MTFHITVPNRPTKPVSLDNLSYVAVRWTKVNDGPTDGEDAIDLRRVHNPQHVVAHRHDVYVSFTQGFSKGFARTIGKRSHVGEMAPFHLRFSDPTADKKEDEAWVALQSFGCI